MENAGTTTTTTTLNERELNKIHSQKAKYLYEKWRENRKLYEEQLRLGKDNGIYFWVAKTLHPKFKDFTPLNLEKYIRDWEFENGAEEEWRISIPFCSHHIPIAALWRSRYLSQGEFSHVCVLTNYVFYLLVVL